MAQDGGRHPDDAHVGVAAAIFARLTTRQRLASVWLTAGFSREEIARHLRITQEELSAEIDAVAQVSSTAPDPSAAGPSWG